MADTGFLRLRHDLSKFSAASNKPANSLIDPSRISAISAYVYNHGTAIAQSGRNDGLLCFVPDYSAWMVPSGSVTATGYSNFFFVAQPSDTDNDHIMAYAPNTVSTYLETHYWSAK